MGEAAEVVLHPLWGFVGVILMIHMFWALMSLDKVMYRSTVFDLFMLIPHIGVLGVSGALGFGFLLEAWF